MQYGGYIAYSCFVVAVDAFPVKAPVTPPFAVILPVNVEVPTTDNVLPSDVAPV